LSSMAHNPPIYDNPHIAELYDQLETHTHDIELIRRLIAGEGPLKILEPFCGTGRILIPLAVEGHQLTGMDQAAAMLGRARMKASGLPAEVQERVTLFAADVVNSDWPRGYELVILGGNCLYELAAPEEQARVMANAAASLKKGGWIYVDNDHMEGELEPSWRESGVQSAYPQGVCADGTVLESDWETVWNDAPNRLARFKRRMKISYPDGREETLEFIQQKHPVSKGEVQDWLKENRFTILQVFGDWDGRQYSDESGRAIFWARKM
jgi:SAM-dependent methyltransferase